MKIIVGLGNPGQQYSSTRHNVGFMAVDELAKRLGISDTWRNKFDALVAEYRGEESIVLVKPQTFMNLSGRSVQSILHWFKVLPPDVIVVYDDLDLPIGRIRIRTKGGAGGHRGIASLIENLSNDSFNRIRIGIGRPPEYMATADFVLSRFTKEENALMEPAIVRASEAVEVAIKHGMTKAANDFNK